MYGAVAVSTELQPYENTTLSLVMSWYFPNRDVTGEILGNHCKIVVFHL